jgi:hypothetical protein
VQFATLHINLFRHALDLGDVDRAFAAIQSLPEPATRVDCIAQFGMFVEVLFKR